MYKLLKKIAKAYHYIYCLIYSKRDLKSFFKESFVLEKILEAYFKVKKADYSEVEKEEFLKLEKYRKELYKNKKPIINEISGKENTVSEIAMRAGSPKKWNEFFYLLTKSTSSNDVLEIGTNLGISGQYFMKGLQSKEQKFISLEGSEKLSEIAKKRLEELGVNFELKVGLFEETLPQLLTHNQKFDVVFFDGNHHFTPTISYFKQLKKSFVPFSILIFDDINWSSDMKKAWSFIKKDKDILYSIDFFKLGVVVFKSNSEDKKHYKLFLDF